MVRALLFIAIRDLNPVANIIILQVVRSATQLSIFLECNARVVEDDLVGALAKCAIFTRVVAHRGGQAPPSEY